jgi:hypothetical protein
MDKKLSKEEIKVLLKDWMVATTQIIKTDTGWKSSNISIWWQSKLGINMKDKWVNRALYG